MQCRPLLRYPTAVRRTWSQCVPTWGHTAWFTAEHTLYCPHSGGHTGSQCPLSHAVSARRGQLGAILGPIIAARAGMTVWPQLVDPRWGFLVSLWARPHKHLLGREPPAGRLMPHPASRWKISRNRGKLAFCQASFSKYTIVSSFLWKTLLVLFFLFPAFVGF